MASMFVDSEPPTPNTMCINYAYGKYGALLRNEQVQSILENANIVLFGEGDFTFTVALAAAIQGKCSKILSTCFESANDACPIPTFDSVQQKCVFNCQQNGELLGVPEQDIIDKKLMINSVKVPIQVSCGVDATTTTLPVRGKVAWFQCPWIPRGSPDGNTASLIINFLNHMATKQMPGDYVLIGITTLFYYVQSYKLGDLLDFTQKVPSTRCSCQGYDFIGADDGFIYKILKLGYHHNCSNLNDIHKKIIRNHITLIFKRKLESDSSYSTILAAAVLFGYMVFKHKQALQDSIL